MDHIKVLINILQLLILAGGGARIVYCLVLAPVDDEEEKSYKVRIRNILVFVVLSETIVGLLRWAGQYFI